ncbi:hypothetical protein [Polaromonas sp.]
MIAFGRHYFGVMRAPFWSFGAGSHGTLAGVNVWYVAALGVQLLYAKK